MPARLEVDDIQPDETAATQRGAASENSSAIGLEGVVFASFSDVAPIKVLNIWPLLETSAAFRPTSIATWASRATILVQRRR
jgi:hypothetical protein